MIEDVEDYVDELPDSYFSKATTIIFDKIDNGKDAVLPSSRFVDLIETLGDGFHSEDLAGHIQKVDPNKSGGLYRLPFVRYYVDWEISLYYTEEGKCLVGWAYKVRLMDHQRELCLIINALNREREQERLYLK